ASEGVTDNTSAVCFQKRNSIALAALCCTAGRVAACCFAARAGPRRHKRSSVERQLNNPASATPPPPTHKPDPLSFLRASWRHPVTPRRVRDCPLSGRRRDNDQLH